ncbi:MAG: hypothetical protein JRI41_08970 [Deltaproteobacteria bacterium]|nr:hypothetical protein [Deltaproteobacteria bacterium]
MGADAYENNMCSLCDWPYLFCGQCPNHCNQACSSYYEYDCTYILEGIYEPVTCECYPPCPIIINVDGKNITLTDSSNGVHFDLNANGYFELTAWTETGKDDAFLVLDRNSNGVIDDGRELFGTASPQPSHPERNGFWALAIFDREDQGGNNDGTITIADSVFTDLRLWIDENHDGFSQSDELYSLLDKGITEIDLNFLQSNKKDRHGNEFRYRAKVYYGGNKQDFAYDVFLVVDPNH